MSVDFTNKIAYGKEFDSFEEALQYLVDNEIITEFEAQKSLDWGDIQSTVNLEYEPYSCYEECGGVLGVYVSAKYMCTEPEKFMSDCDKVDEYLGNGCEIHEFVKVH